MWPSRTRFCLLLITLAVPPIFYYRFQPASLASLLCINFQFRFNLVVGSLLSPLDLCNTMPSSMWGVAFTACKVSFLSKNLHHSFGVADLHATAHTK